MAGIRPTPCGGMRPVCWSAATTAWTSRTTRTNRTTCSCADCPVAQRRCSPSCSSRTAGRAALARSSLTNSVRRVPRMARLPRVCRVLPGRPRLSAAGLRVWRVRRIRTLSLVPLSATAGNPLHTAPTDIHPLRAHTHARAHAHARIHTSGTPIYTSTTTHPTPQHAHLTHHQPFQRALGPGAEAMLVQPPVHCHQ